jgi:uncharacterized protein YebE (UPF0316 family)
MEALLLSPQAWLGAGLIFLLRVTDMTLDTIRTLMVLRGLKLFAWVLGFFQALVFVVAISSVLAGVNNPLNVLGYAAGFATGNVVGILVEGRLALGHTNLRIISPRRGSAIADRLREEGYAITEIPARGKDGMVTILTMSVMRKKVMDTQQLINQVDPDAFITAEDVRPVRRGYWRA